MSFLHLILFFIDICGLVFFVCTACLVFDIIHTFRKHNSFIMNEAFVDIPVDAEQGRFTSNLLTTKLEQLGYQCLSDSCDRFTTLRLVPLEIKRKEENIIPPSE